MREEFRQTTVREGIYSAQNIFQVVERIDFICFAGSNQTHKDGGGFAAAFATHEQEILLTQNNRSDSIFGHVIIRLETQFCQVVSQDVFLILSVCYGFADG